jgi:hypothetical protein
MKSLSMTGEALAEACLPATGQAAPDPICGRWLTEGKQGVVNIHQLRLGSGMVLDADKTALIMAAGWAF